jgi:hypothetical protein
MTDTQHDEQPGIFDSRGNLAPLSAEAVAKLSPDRQKRYADVSAAAIANTNADLEIGAARKAIKAAEKAMVEAGARLLALQPKISFLDALRAAQAAYRNSR